MGADWIHRADVFPPAGAEVLVTDGEVVWLGYSDGETLWYVAAEAFNNRFETVGIPTHWMALPAPPPNYPLSQLAEIGRN